jgi:mannose-6-phosphate isomerase-like protein (cupin superfamily)
MLALLLFFLFFGYSTPAPAPAASTAGGTVVTSADIADALKNAKQNPNSIAGTLDVTVRSIDAGNGYIGVATVHRTLPETNDAVLHEKITEVYHITEGGGTIELGGTLIGGKAFGPNTGVPAIGPSLRGTGIRGGHSQHVGAGDVVVIPPGTPHRFTTIDGPITYICIRLDPGKITPLK